MEKMIADSVDSARMLDYLKTFDRDARVNLPQLQIELGITDTTRIDYPALTKTFGELRHFLGLYEYRECVNQLKHRIERAVNALGFTDTMAQALLDSVQTPHDDVYPTESLFVHNHVDEYRAVTYRELIAMIGFCEIR